MESRIMQVFYGNDLLPYKDKERSVHYPIVGNTFAGSHKTTNIRFYVDQIGGTDTISWVVVSKLPNGVIGYEPLSDIGYDDEGKPYLDFDMSGYYTSVKGDLYLALRGYQGQITFEDDDNDGVYSINGDPLIEVTGTIKLAINYSPMVNTGTQVLPTDIDRIISALSNYLKIENGIVVLPNTSADITDYDNGQIFFVKSDTKFYKKYNNALTLFEFTNFNIDDFNHIVNGNNVGLEDYFESYVISYVTENAVTINTNQYIEGEKAFKDLVADEAFNIYCGITFQNGTYSNPTGVHGVLEPSGVDRLTYTDAGENTHTIAYRSDIAALGTIYQYKGSKTVTELNQLASLLGIQAGYAYNVSNSGTLTAGNIQVVAGDNVVWDGTKWDKLSGDYVPSARTIAGISLSNNITAQSLTDALVFATNSEIDALFE